MYSHIQVAAPEKPPGRPCPPLNVHALVGNPGLHPAKSWQSMPPDVQVGMGLGTVQPLSVACSAWNRAADALQWKVSVPVNATAKVYLPTFTTAATALTVSEGGTEIFKNAAAAGSVPGVTFDQVEGVSPQAFVVFNVGSGTYEFAWNAQ